MADDLIRALVWKNHRLNGTDYCALWHTSEGWLLKGTVVGALKDQRPMLAKYKVHCDDNWLTQRVQVERTIGKDTKTLTLSVDMDGVWRSLGQELREVVGCLDVDLAVTPATNTLPVRRLDLGIGMSQSVTAAWIKFPELTVQPLSQRYTRISENIYRYESDTGFSSEVVVDDLGLVINYLGGWERIATL
jgi:uncharacterized protein